MKLRCETEVLILMRVELFFVVMGARVRMGDRTNRGGGRGGMGVRTSAQGADRRVQYEYKDKDMTEWVLQGGAPRSASGRLVVYEACVSVHASFYRLR